MKKISLRIILISGVSLLIRFFVAPLVVPNSPGDDFQGVLAANNILNGLWLGPWSSTSLIKPPGYAFVLVLAAKMQLSPLILVHILYLTVSILLVKLIFSSVFHNLTTKNQGAFVFLYTWFAFNPSMFSSQASRIYRDVFTAVLIALFAYLSSLIFSECNKPKTTKHEMKKGKNIWILISLLGLTLGFLLITRPESIWVIFPLPIAFLASGKLRPHLIRKFVFSKSGRVHFSKFLLVLLVFGITAQIPIQLVEQANQKHYQVGITDDWFKGEFPRAMKLWSSVSNGEDDRSNVPVSKGQRSTVYSISPTAKTLSNILEADPKFGWARNVNCQFTQVCDEVGSFFPNQVREAAEIGGINSAIEFQVFFKKIADDIEHACDSKTIACGAKGLAPGAKSLTEFPKSELLDSTIGSFAALIDFQQVGNFGRPKFPQDSTLEIWKATVPIKFQYTTNSFSEWKSLKATVSFLKRIYQTLIVSIFVLYFLSRIRKSDITAQDESSFKFLNMYCLCALVIYSVLMGVMESSFGWNGTFEQYTIPIQPIFMTLIALNLALAWKRLVEVEK